MATAVHTFTSVRMASGPDRDLVLLSYGETAGYGRWAIADAVTGERLQLEAVHAALEAYLGHPITLHDLASPPPDGDGASWCWPDTWSTGS